MRVAIIEFPQHSTPSSSEEKKKKRDSTRNTALFYRDYLKLMKVKKGKAQLKHFSRTPVWRISPFEKFLHMCPRHCHARNQPSSRARSK